MFVVLRKIYLLTSPVFFMGNGQIFALTVKGSNGFIIKFKWSAMVMTFCIPCSSFLDEVSVVYLCPQIHTLQMRTLQFCQYKFPFAIMVWLSVGKMLKITSTKANFHIYSPIPFYYSNLVYIFTS